MHEIFHTGQEAFFLAGAADAWRHQPPSIIALLSCGEEGEGRGGQPQWRSPWVTEIQQHKKAGQFQSQLVEKKMHELKSDTAVSPPPVTVVPAGLERHSLEPRYRHQLEASVRSAAEPTSFRRRGRGFLQSEGQTGNFQSSGNE